MLVLNLIEKKNKNIELSTFSMLVLNLISENVYGTGTKKRGKWVPVLVLNIPGSVPIPGTKCSSLVRGQHWAGVYQSESVKRL
ncbi:hypothetical protein HanPSC8_Chr06g0231691 [Helianthus annuus]|nr:hypothetical protein HanPSC8_Chr06g0231691 [Helianthus annuus]